jgi:multiple sugar transport system permease protein
MASRLSKTAAAGVHYVRSRPRSLSATFRRGIARAALYAAMLGALVLFAFPVYWLFTGAFKAPSTLLDVPPQWFPSPWTIVNFDSLFSYRDVHLLRYAMNTAYICGFSVIATVMASSLAAYGFARLRFPGRDVLFGILIVTLILPPWATIVPQYVLFSWFGWLGSFKPLTFPYLCGDAFTIFLFRQFMLGIPTELSESARLDGANEFTIYWRIILPLMKPVLVVGGLFAFIFTYNDFFGPLIYLQDANHYTISLAVFFFVQVRGIPDIGTIVAFTALVVLPLVVTFFFAQRALMRGIKLTGLRG